MGHSYVVDWPLVLEFAKVLAGPVATVLAVWLVSRMAVRTYRGQKTIERRLDWYERVYRQIDQFAYALQGAGIAQSHDRDSPEAKTAAADFFKCASGLRDLLSAAYLYATATGFDATGRLVAAVKDFLEQESRTGDLSDNQRLLDVCLSVSGALAEDIRGEMGMTLLGPQRPSLIRKVWSTLAGHFARR